MEVTFLSSTGSFAGVEYNLSKVLKNAGELLDVRNFDGLSHIANPTIGDYTDYLKAWSERNTRIKNSQFHVAISCRGREKSKEELLAAAIQWMKEMGYEGIPALYVFNKDTDNNHIHIVSSRVDPKGVKVAHSNEWWRGRAELKKIEGVRLSEQDKTKNAISNALSYRFSNKKQFLMLLESQKYKITELENGDVAVMKYGRQVGVVSKNVIEEARFIGEKSKEVHRRENQLKAILYKYKEKMDLAELKDLMSKSFGVELIFFGHKDKPYGYAIIDHKSKIVHKGGDIMALKELLGQRKANKANNINYREKGEKLISLVLDNDERKATIKEVNSILKKHGYSIRKGGRLYYYSRELGQVDMAIQERLEYNNRLARTQKIKTNDPRALEALARHFNVRREDLFLSSEVNKANNNDYISAQDLYDKAYMSGELLYYLKLYNAFIIDDQGKKKFLVEIDNKSITEIDTTNIDQSVAIDDITSLIMMNEKGGQASSANNELKKRKRKKR